MRAMAFANPGGPEVLQIMDLPKPSLEDDEVLVQVKACALNHLDVWVRQGLPTKIPMPHIGGCEITGIVAEVGRNVRDAKIGQRVLISPGQSCMHCDWCNQGLDSCCDQFHIIGYQTQGGFAEYAKARAVDLLPISEAWSFAEWSAVPTPLDAPKTTTSSFGFTRARSCSMFQAVTNVSGTAGGKVEIDLRFFFSQQHCILGAYMGSRHGLLQCLRLIEKRVFQPVVDSVFPLEKLREAQERMEKREMFGKIVVTP